MSQECQQRRRRVIAIERYVCSMREFTDNTGSRWRVEMISRGRTSEYLNAKVHRPILQFSCLNRRVSRRYLGYALKEAAALETLSDAELQELLQRASAH